MSWSLSVKNLCWRAAASTCHVGMLLHQKYKTTWCQGDCINLIQLHREQCNLRPFRQSYSVDNPRVTPIHWCHLRRAGHSHMLTDLTTSCWCFFFFFLFEDFAQGGPPVTYQAWPTTNCFLLITLVLIHFLEMHMFALFLSSGTEKHTEVG